MNVKQWSISAKLEFGSACLPTSPDQSSMETVELKAEEVEKFVRFVGLQEKNEGMWRKVVVCFGVVIFLKIIAMS